MIKLPLLLLLLSNLWLYAKTIKPKTMHARDHHRYYNRSNTVHHNNPLLSTMESSVEITSVISCEASTQATTEQRDHGNAHISNFLEENRIEISRDIAQAQGEHLQTLLSMMQLSRNESYLLSLQSNFESLIYLDTQQFLKRLRTIHG
jgi:hypothetical protein